MRKNHVVRIQTLLAASMAALLALAPLSASADEVDDEFVFMSGLIELGLPDYAEKALEMILLKRPDLKDRAKIIRAEILVSKKKFTEAEEIAKSLPAGSDKARTIQLAIANGYYRFGEIEKAQALYKAFFQEFGNKAPEDADLRRLFQESAYTYARMMEMQDMLEEAAKAYDMVLVSKPGTDVERPLMAEQAKLYADLARKAEGAKKKEFCDRVTKLSQDLQWGGMDLWFGKSIIHLAEAEMICGDKEKAKNLIKDYLDILKSIDNSLKEAGMSLDLSPMADVRFLSGEISLDLAETAKAAGDKAEAGKHYAAALKEFFNVFMKYGSSPKGPDSGIKAQEIKTILEEEFGKRVKIDIPAGLKPKAGPEVFRAADNFYTKKLYDQAAEEYLAQLNRYPETDQSPRVLSRLTQRYLRLDDTLMVEVILAYAGERFADSDEAAKVPLIVGSYYLKEKKDEASAMKAYDTYLKYFPNDSKAGAILFNMAGFSKKAGDEARRMVYLDKLINDYKHDQYYLKALRTLAWGAYKNEDYESTMKYFELFLADAQPSADKAKAKFAYADCFVRDQQYVAAYKQYLELAKWLDPEQKSNPFNTSAEDQKENASVLEKTKFQLANCLSLIKAPPPKDAAIQKKASEAYDEFLTTYPKSELASKAMAGQGRLLLAMGQFDPATKMFDDLASRFPDSPEGKNAVYSLIKAAMEVDKVEIAKSAFDKMAANAASYSSAEFFRVGKLFYEVGAYEQAIPAYEKAKEGSEERALLERALYAIGDSHFQLENCEAALPPLEELMDRFPKSGLFYDAKFILAECYLKTEEYEKGRTALTDIFKYADKSSLQHKASYTLGEIQYNDGDLDGSYASAQRVALLGDPNDPESRPWIEKSLMKSIQIGQELERWKDALESCDQYLKQFPDGANNEEVRKIRREVNLKASMMEEPVEEAPAP